MPQIKRYSVEGKLLLRFQIYHSVDEALDFISYFNSAFNRGFHTNSYNLNWHVIKIHN